MAMRKKSGRQSGRQLMRESYSGRIFSLRQTFWQDNVLVQMLMYGKEAKNKNKIVVAPGKWYGDESIPFYLYDKAWIIMKP